MEFMFQKKLEQGYVHNGIGIKIDFMMKIKLKKILSFYKPFTR